MDRKFWRFWNVFYCLVCRVTQLTLLCGHISRGFLSFRFWPFEYDLLVYIYCSYFTIITTSCNSGWERCLLILFHHHDNQDTVCAHVTHVDSMSLYMYCLFYLKCLLRCSDHIVQWWRLWQFLAAVRVSLELSTSVRTEMVSLNSEHNPHR